MRLLLALLLVSCSSLDPNVGPFHVDRVTSDDPDDAGDVDAGDARTGSAEGSAAPDGTSPPPGRVSFRRDIRPLINRPASGDPTGRGCKSCHFPTEPNHQGVDLGGLDLSTLGALRQGGGSTGRRIIVAGRPAESGFVQKLRGVYPYGTRMPKNGAPFWTDAEVKIVSDWIAEGAKGADDE
ncbi:MAG TPA: hypothetical protein VJT73_06825 [Polyangiaceae bacterium]|nr:hypothetical protein [Polyangiaceae bacterium]